MALWPPTSTIVTSANSRHHRGLVRRSHTAAWLASAMMCMRKPATRRTNRDTLATNDSVTRSSSVRARGAARMARARRRDTTSGSVSSVGTMDNMDNSRAAAAATNKWPTTWRRMTTICPHTVVSLTMSMLSHEVTESMPGHTL